MSEDCKPTTPTGLDRLQKNIPGGIRKGIRAQAI